MRQGLDYLDPVLALVALVVVWEVATTSGDILRYILPSASETMQSLMNNWPLLFESAG